jgi:hypothetical protein
MRIVRLSDGFGEKSGTAGLYSLILFSFYSVA